MKRYISICLACLFFILCVCGCDLNKILESELKVDTNSQKAVSKTGSERGEIILRLGESTIRTRLYYDNSSDASQLKFCKNERCTYNESRTLSGTKSMVFTMDLFDFNDNCCVRCFNGQYYCVQKVKTENDRIAYLFTFWDEIGNEICHFCIEKLYSAAECNIISGKTTINDLKKFFPYDSLSSVTELQFREGEYQLEFSKKGSDYVLDKISTPAFTLSVSKSILPKDLALITNNK